MQFNAPAPQMGAAPQFNQHQFVQANMSTLAQFNAKKAPPAPVKKSGVKDKVKKYWLPLTSPGLLDIKLTKPRKRPLLPPSTKEMNEYFVIFPRIFQSIHNQIRLVLIY